MQLIHPDILAEAKGLSIGAAGFATLVGALLWGLGWRWHRFWIVFGITLSAGLIGLNSGQAAGGQVLVVGILLALAAGMMALEMARVLAFVAGGVVAWIAIQTILPAAREMWAVFLCGGLLGLLLYRLWTMVLTSCIGSLLTVYGVTILIAVAFQVDVVTYAQKNTTSLNFVVGLLAFAGVGLQHYISKIDRENAEASESDATIIPIVAEEAESKNSDKGKEMIAMTWWKKITTRKAA